MFPSSDPTIKQRGHVNHAHLEFAVWNVAHTLMQKGCFGITKALAKEAQSTVHKLILPDQPIRLEWELLRLPLGKKKGFVCAEFYFSDTDVLCAELLAKFAAVP